MTIERQLTRSWRRLGTSVRAFLQSVGSGTALPSWPELRFEPEDSKLGVSLTHPVVLLNVPPRAKTRRSWRLVLAIEAHFTVSSETHEELLNYGTRVSYFGIDKSRAQELKLLHAFHYDMDVSGLAGHPLFHAQPYEGMDVEELDTIRLLRDFSIAEGDNGAPTIQNIRIPTAQMDLLSVCVMLLADHFLQEKDNAADEAFATFVLESAVSQSPLVARNQPRMLEFFQKIQDGGMDVRSCHWYPYESGPGA